MVVAVGLVVKVADGAIASASSHPPFWSWHGVIGLVVIEFGDDVGLEVIVGVTAVTHPLGFVHGFDVIKFGVVVVVIQPLGLVHDAFEVSVSQFLLKSIPKLWSLVLHGLDAVELVVGVVVVTQPLGLVHDFDVIELVVGVVVIQPLGLEHDFDVIEPVVWVVIIQPLGLEHGIDVIEPVVGVVVTKQPLGLVHVFDDWSHASLLQVWVCLDLPKHSEPPFLAGISTFLDFTLIPFPHVLEHDVQSLQADQLQLTINSYVLF